MTMKTKKTLQHIAAVAVVLLTLCLVFAAPVSADAATVTVNGEAAASLQDALDSVKSDNTIIVLSVGEVAGTTYTYDGDYSITIQGQGEETRLVGNLTIGKAISATNPEVPEAVKEATITVENISFGEYYLSVVGYKTVNVLDNIFASTSFPTIGANKYGAISVWWTANKSIKGSVVIDGNTISVDGGDGIHVWGFCNADITENVISNADETAMTVCCGYSGGKITISDNEMTNWGAGEIEGRALRLDVRDGDATVSFTDNIMKNEASPEQFVKITGVSNADVSDNYWNGRNPIGTFGSGIAYYNFQNAAVTEADKVKFYYANDERTELVAAGEAEVNGVQYNTLDGAVAAAAGATVTLLKDVELSSEVNLTIDKSLTLDGKGLKISGDTSHGVIDLFGGSDEGITVTIKNITVTNDKNYAVRVATKANLNIDGSILDGFGAVYVTQNGITNADAQGDASTVIITNSKLSSTGTNEAFGTVAIFANSTKISISGSTLDVTMPKENTGTQAIVRFGSNTKDAVHTGSSVSIVDSTLNVIKEDGSTGTAAIFSKGNKETGTLAFTLGEGVYSNVNPSAYIAEGMEVVQPGNLYKVQVYVDRSSSSSSSVKPEEPEQPEEPVVEPETPTEEPVAGEPTVETEVTDGGEVTFETPAEPENPDAGEPGDAPANAPAEPAVTGVVLPEGTDSEVAFIPVSEKPAPAGKEENTKKVFEINVPKYEKGKPATVKFTMTVAELEKDGKTAADVALWHHDEETGEWTKLVTTFVIKDGIVYFEAITFDFSPFAIVYEDTELPTDEPETPEQPTESPAPILAVLAGLGAAVVLRRK